MTTAAQTIAETEITGLTSDSRRVEPGFLFAALPGARADGRAFIPQAIENGARTILAPPGTRLPPPGRRLALVTDENPRRRFALLAARFYIRQPECVVAVTGTNGKTSVVSFLRQIWRSLGHRAASLGTLGWHLDDAHEAGALTTPDPAELHRLLAGWAADGVSHLAMEASSHGLAQYRLDGVRLKAAAFTNLSRDHLDYHGSEAAYLAAKLRLVEDLLPEEGCLVVNADAEHAEAFLAAADRRGLRVLGVGAAGRDIRLLGNEPLADGQRLRLRLGGREHVVDLPLVGGFQASNALCALGLALAVGADIGAERAVALLETLQGAPGRLERVAETPSGAPVYVDYAHTPDALANVLAALRPHVAGRLWVVFGCGGDRDAGKRPEMGRVAARLADGVVVTDDNPRGEDAAAIRRQVLVGCSGAREIGDRAEAIRAAVAELEAGDALVVAGKGHETGQIVGDTVRPFEDAAVVRRMVREAGR